MHSRVLFFWAWPSPLVSLNKASRRNVYMGMGWAGQIHLSWLPEEVLEFLQVFADCLATWQWGEVKKTCKKENSIAWTLFKGRKSTHRHFEGTTIKHCFCDFQGTVSKKIVWLKSTPFNTLIYVGGSNEIINFEWKNEILKLILI